MQQDLFLKKQTSYPSTRYQGSKRKLLPALADKFSSHNFKTALDLFSGSGSVTYLLRSLNKSVLANDYLKYNHNTADLFLSEITSPDIAEAKKILPDLLHDRPHEEQSAVRDNFSTIFFTDEENEQIDFFCQNVVATSPAVRKLLVYAVGQALLKKRPYNLFHRANLGMRLSDVERSFGNKVTWETPIAAHALKALDEIAKLSLDELPVGRAENHSTDRLELLPADVDLVYLDPPYIPAKGKAIDYADFYGFLDGLLQYDLFKSPQTDVPHRPILRKRSAWADPKTAKPELRNILEKWRDSQIVLSYRGDGAFTPEEMIATFNAAGRTATLQCLGTYKYALASPKGSNEILISSPPLGR